MMDLDVVDYFFRPVVIKSRSPRRGSDICKAPTKSNDNWSTKIKTGSSPRTDEQIKQ